MGAGCELPREAGERPPRWPGTFRADGSSKEEPRSSWEGALPARELGGDSASLARAAWRRSELGPNLPRHQAAYGTGEARSRGD